MLYPVYILHLAGNRDSDLRLARLATLQLPLVLGPICRALPAPGLGLHSSSHLVCLSQTELPTHCDPTTTVLPALSELSPTLASTLLPNHCQVSPASPL